MSQTKLSLAGMEKPLTYFYSVLPIVSVHYFHTYFAMSRPAKTTLQRHYTENSRQIFPKMKLRGLIPNAYIQVSVRFIYAHDWSAYSAVGK